MEFIDGIVDTILSEHKICSKCGLPKLKDLFSKRKASKDGLKSSCKGCVKAYYQENKLAIAEQKAGYYQENKVAIAEYQAGYSAKPESKTKRNARLTKRRQTDEGFRHLHNLRSRLVKAMKGKKKSASTLKLVGLQSGTAINNHLNVKSPWFKERGIPSEELDTDHIIPCAEYKLEKPDHQKACFHYTNLQYLTKLDNQKKSDKVPEGFNFKSTLKKQLDLIARIEKDKLTYQQVLEMQKTGELYEVVGYQV